MTSSSLPPAERARKISSTVLQAAQRDARQSAIAVALGCSESTVSRLLSEHLDRFAGVLAHAGLKVVPVEMQCFRPDSIQALLTLAKDRLATIDRPDQLTWE